MTFHAAYEPQRAVRTERFKYIRRFHDYDHPVLANCDDSATKSLLVEAGWGDQIVPREHLYDLLLDPNEDRNLAAEPSHERGPRRARRPAPGMDEGDRRPAPRRPGRAAPGCGRQPPGRSSRRPSRRARDPAAGEPAGAVR